MKNEILTTLTAEQRTRRDSLKQTVTSGINNFIEVGNALAGLQNEKLYLETHTTFADFCRENWNVGSRRAYQLIAAASVVDNVNHGSHSDLPEVTERALRPLAKLTPAKQRKAWAKLDKSKSITVTAVVQAVAKVQPADQAIRPIDQKADLPPPTNAQAAEMSAVYAGPSPLEGFKAQALKKWETWFWSVTNPNTSKFARPADYDQFVKGLLK